jgi:AbrB family looped-hinge helix DNA binding protein
MTSKGQVTVPVEIRRQLDLQPGDDLIFEVDQGNVSVRALHRRRASDFRGSLPATRSFPGRDTVREKTAQTLGEGLELGNSR